MSDKITSCYNCPHDQWECKESGICHIRGKE